MSKKKWKAGRRIVDLDDLWNQEFVVWHGKVYHKAWVYSWPLRMCKIMIDAGSVRKAVPIDN